MTEQIRNELGSGAKIFGILAIIFGIGAIILWGIVFVPLGIITSIIALALRNYVYGGVGLVCSIIGIFLSPTLILAIGFGTAVSTANNDEIKPIPKVVEREVAKQPAPALAPEPKPVALPKKETITPVTQNDPVVEKLVVQKIDEELPRPPSVEEKQVAVVTQNGPVFSTSAIGTDQSLGFDLAKVSVTGDEWCSESEATIAVIAPQGRFIQNSLGILQTAAQLAEFECPEAKNLPVLVLKEKFEGNMKELTNAAYFNGSMIKSDNGWEMR